MVLSMIVAAVGNTGALQENLLDSSTTNYCASLSIDNVPNAGSMLSGETRKWYNSNLEKIPQILNSEPYSFATEREKAQLSFSLRNCYKHLARVAMKCTKCADYLNANEPPLTFESLEKKYSKNYTMIMEKAYKSRESVNKFSKISDFFEKHTPWLYENFLFQIAMKLSRIFDSCYGCQFFTLRFFTLS